MYNSLHDLLIEVTGRDKMFAVVIEVLRVVD